MSAIIQLPAMCTEKWTQLELKHLSFVKLATWLDVSTLILIYFIIITLYYHYYISFV